MSCHNCRNQPCNGDCVGCGSCDPCPDTCGPSNPLRDQVNCQGGQIEQLKARTDQLWQQVDSLNTGDQFEDLCPVQTCSYCPPVEGCSSASGTMCGGSPTGKPAGCDEDAPQGLRGVCEIQGKKIRELGTDVAQLARQLDRIRDQAIARILIDNSGMVRGGMTISNKLKNFSPGSWEIETTP